LFKQCFVRCATVRPRSFASEHLRETRTLTGAAEAQDMSYHKLITTRLTGRDAWNNIVATGESHASHH
jgi:hypothetical protein